MANRPNMTYRMKYGGFEGDARSLLGDGGLSSYVNIPAPQQQAAQSTVAPPPFSLAGDVKYDIMSDSIQKYRDQQSKLKPLVAYVPQRDLRMGTNYVMDKIPHFASDFEVTDENREQQEKLIRALWLLLGDDKLVGVPTAGAYLSLIKLLLNDGSWKKLLRHVEICEVELENVTLRALQEKQTEIEYYQRWLDARMRAEEKAAKGERLTELEEEARRQEHLPPAFSSASLFLKYLTIAEAQEHALSPAAYNAILGLLLLFLAKKLTPDNHAEYINKRLDTFKTHLSVEKFQVEWLKGHKPHQEVCEEIHSRFGSTTSMRRYAMDAVISWSADRAEGHLKKLSNVLLSLFQNVDLTHITMIINFIIQEVPSLFATPPLRAESANVFAAILRLTTLKDMAPYARMLHSAKELPELQRSGMRLAASFAQDLAQRDFPSFSNYAQQKNETFESLKSELYEYYHRMRKITPLRYDRLVDQEYGQDQKKLLAAAMQPGVVVTMTAAQMLGGAANQDNMGDN